MHGQTRVENGEGAVPGKYSGLAPLNFWMVMTVAILGALIPVVLPLVLAGLVHEQRITTAQVGHAATSELLGMAIATAVAATWVPAIRLRMIGAVCGVALTAVNLATLYLSGMDVVLIRGVGGVCGGIFLWMMIGMLARSDLPARWSGVYLAVQSLLGLALSAAFTAWVIPRYGANGGFIALALVSAIIVLAAPFLPDRYAELTHERASGTGSVAQGGIALVSVGLFMAANMALWIYVEPLARQAGQAFAIAGTAITIGTGTQIAGSAVASLLARRLNFVPVIIWGGVVSAALTLVLPMLSHAGLFVFAIAVVGFLWTLILPFQVPLVIAADPTRRMAMQIGGVQLLGAGVGPVLASLAVRGDDVGGTATLIAAVFAVSLAITVVQQRTLRTALAQQSAEALT